MVFPLQENKRRSAKWAITSRKVVVATINKFHLHFIPTSRLLQNGCSLQIAAPVYQMVNTSFKGYIVSVDRLARGTPESIPSIPLFIKNCVFRI
jgi:hypothetical protein